MMKRTLALIFVAVFTFLGFSTDTYAQSTASQIISAGKSQIGTPYKWGGTTTSGFDCSGFTRYAFSQASIDLPRTAADQYQGGTTVSRSDLQPGDLVFFSTYKSGASHNGIYIGNNKFIHSSSSKGVSISSLNNSYWNPRYIGARRYLDGNNEVSTLAAINQENAVSVEINGENLSFDQDPVVVNGRTLVPMRNVFENLGATVYWDGETKQVFAKADDEYVRLVIGDRTAETNEGNFELKEPAQLVNSRTVVPLRFISESFGAEVQWHADERKVTITQ